MVSIGEVVKRLAWGEVDVILSGGTDSAMTPLAVAGFSRLGVLSPQERRANSCVRAIRREPRTARGPRRGICRTGAGDAVACD